MSAKFGHWLMPIRDRFQRGGWARGEQMLQPYQAASYYCSFACPRHRRF